MKNNLKVEHYSTYDTDADFMTKPIKGEKSLQIQEQSYEQLFQLGNMKLPHGRTYKISNLGKNKSMD